MLGGSDDQFLVDEFSDDDYPNLKPEEKEKNFGISMLDSNNQSEEIKSKDEKLYPSELDYENFSYYTHPELVVRNE